MAGNARNVLNELIKFIKDIVQYDETILTIYVVGLKNTVETIGKNIDKEYLSKGKVIIYKLDERRDWESQVLRIFVNTLPDIIVYFMRELSEEESFKTMYFYLLGVKSNRRIVSYCTSSTCLKIGEVYNNINDLEKALEE